MTTETTTIVTTPVVQGSVQTPTTLTVIVTDHNNQPAPGARVTMAPSDATGLTDAQGQVQFKLGEALKYNVTVTLGSDTVTVPYYVTSGGSARLMVNPTYVKAVEAQNSGGFGLSGYTTPLLIGGSILVVIIIVWMIFRRRRR